MTAIRRRQPFESVTSDSAHPGLVLLLLLSFLFGCSDWTESAKVLPDAPPLTLEERWRLDGSRQLLGPVAWVVVGPAGDIFVGHDLDRRIIVFDSLGDRRAILGGAGRDPGNFENLARAGTVRDSLWVYDAVLRRVTMYRPDLALARTFVWPPPYDRATLDATRDATIPYLLGITPRGSIVASVYRERFPPGQAEVADTTVPPVAIPDRALLLTEPVPSNVVYADGFLLDNTRLFPVDPLFAAAADGSAFVYVEPSVDGAEAGTFRVTRFDVEGDTVFVRRHPFYPVEIPREVAGRAITQAIRRMRVRGQDTPEAIEIYRKSVRIPPAYSPIEGAVVGRDGSTWLRMRPLVSRNSEYYILDANGDLVGRLSVAGGLEIQAANLTQVWSVVTDTLGVESVVVYAVHGLGTRVPRRSR